MRWGAALVIASACTNYGYGASQTTMVGRADNAAGTADLSVEQRSVEAMMFVRAARVLVFAEAGLSAFTVRERAGDQAMEPDDIGIGDRTAVGGGYTVPMGTVRLTPFVSYSMSLANSALTGTSPDDDIGQSTIDGGPGAGVDVELERAGVTPYLRVSAERVGGRVIAGLFDPAAGPSGVAYTATAVLFTVGLRGEMLDR